jgi:hypothetical protein
METEYNKENGKVIKKYKVVYIDYLILKKYLDKKEHAKNDSAQLRDLYKDA